MSSAATAYDVCSFLGLRKAMRHVTQFYDRELAPSGLRITQFSILSRLRQLGPCGINALAAEMVMDRTTMGRNLRPLEAAGLVAIETDPGDRRGRRAQLTPEGLARLRAARPYWAAAQQGFERCYGPERAEHLRHVLAAIVATPLDTAE